MLGHVNMSSYGLLNFSRFLLLRHTHTNHVCPRGTCLPPPIFFRVCGCIARFCIFHRRKEILAPYFFASQRLLEHIGSSSAMASKLILPPARFATSTCMFFL